MEQENAQLKQEYTRITGMLQNNIQRTIYQTVNQSQYSKPLEVQSQRPDYGFKYK